MEQVHSCIAPLSPFTWDAAGGDGQSGSSANSVLHDIALLDLRFDLVIDEFAVPCNHTLHHINGGYPLRRKNLTQRQLQLLQYGAVVHGAMRLVIAAVPPCCGDSGACLAASYEHLFSRSLDVASAVAHHPLLPEHTFIVYRLPDATAKDQQRPEALFRFVYRNVNPNCSFPASAADDLDVASAPEYKLVAVLVSSATYYGELQRFRQYWREWYAHSAATRASGFVEAEAVAGDDAPQHDVLTAHPLPERVAAEVRRTSSLSKLCTCFALVLERFAAVEDEGDASSVVSASDNDAGVNDNNSNDDNGIDKERDAAADGVNDSYKGKTSHRHRQHRMYSGSDPWSYQYTRDGARLVGRLDVVERTKATLQAWRDGALDLTETIVQRVPQSSATTVVIGAHSTHPPLFMQPRRVPCARLLLQPAHKDISTQVAGNEIVSYLPNDESVVMREAGATGAFATVVYASPAAERLRRWILQGLIAAEVHAIHAVFLDLDPGSLLLPCVDLLAEADDDVYDDVQPAAQSEDEQEAGTATTQLRYKRALLLVCQVAMETVERFVRHSGLVWKVTVAVHETTAGCRATLVSNDAEPTSFTEWCRGILELLREAEAQREAAAMHNTLSFDDGGEEYDDTEADMRAVALALARDQNALVSSGMGPLLDNLSTSQQLAFRTQEVVERALTLYTRESSGPATPLPPHIVAKAKAVGVKVNDTDLYSLFRTFCAAAKRKDMLLPASTLVDVLTEEWTTEAAKRGRYAASSPRLVCPLDGCGVPVTRTRVQRFLQPFLDVMRDAPQSHIHFPAAGAATSHTLNYAQFSMVMFAIAKM
jgi:hypothetical protein